ncbi:MAG: sulfite exporter TauE/SafE family protein [Firmicutes bacterium]|nr:sulfite exporter TauE/SafE family protein [Bacillota bacterium]
MEFIVLLTILGVFVGMVGTMIGAGGGFILVPVLLILFPNKTPEEITSISLAVVFFNAVSGTLAYRKMKRIDYKSGILFSIATIPGAILGSFVVGILSRNIFNLIFGTLLIIIATYLALKPDNKNSITTTISDKLTVRKIIDSDNNEYVYSYNKYLGMFLSLIVGFVSSLLGIGGGIIHVPILVHILNFPVHLATATSHFVLAIMSFTGSLVHLFNGTLASSFLQVLLLSVGAILGAQIGARLSNKLKGRLIIRLLALALAIVGIRIFFLAFA